MGKTASSSLVFLLIALLLPFSLFLFSPFTANPKSKEISSETKAEETIIIMPTTTEIFGVKIEKNPPQSKLDELGVTSWPKWSSEPRKIPWTFKSTETMYLFEGKVKVCVDGYEECFEIGGGDLVVFPKGMKITWDVLDPVTKHYSLEE